jgi:chromosomal replication initiation ATPase DnaA
MTEQQLLTDICHAVGIKESDVLGTRRHRDTVMARFLYLYGLHKYLKHTAVAAGTKFGLNLDHSSVLHACKTIQGYVNNKDQTTTEILVKLVNINPVYHWVFGMSKKPINTYPLIVSLGKHKLAI